MLPISLNDLWPVWTGPAPSAVALLGSYARGDADEFSDVDILLLLPEDGPDPARTSFLINDRLVVINPVRPEQIGGWFTQPEQAVQAVASLREAVAIDDPAGDFARLQARANNFVWDAAMQAKADSFASGELVGLIEEAHKGLGGLGSGEPGRLLNASFGLSWLPARTVRIQRGVLGNSDNGFYADVRQAVGLDSRWSALLEAAFGVAEVGTSARSLPERVRAGLALYCETARLLDAAIQPDDRPLIEATVARIETNVTRLQKASQPTAETR